MVRLLVVANLKLMPGRSMKVRPSLSSVRSSPANTVQTRCSGKYSLKETRASAWAQPWGAWDDLAAFDKDRGEQLGGPRLRGSQLLCANCVYTKRRYIFGGVVFSPELKKGSTEMLILSLVDARSRHGYEIGKLIEARSGGRLTFALPTLYPTLLRLENRGWIKGRWVEKPGERERCFYRLTPEGRRVLAQQRATWKAYVAAVNAVIEAGDA